jgi:pimeloyl-ACP methyl ester carboxylesterase
MSWLGSALLMPLETAPLLTGGQRDSAAYRQAGREGLPVLAIYGTEDKLADAKAAAEEFKKDFKDVELVGLEGAGHAITEEKPREVNAAIKNFVKRIHAV